MRHRRANNLSLAQSNGDVVVGEAGAQGTGQAGGEWVRGVEHEIRQDLSGVRIIEDAPADWQHIADQTLDAVVRASTRMRPVPGPPTGLARETLAVSVRYSRWDGTQQGFDLDAEAILAEINDDLLYHGDVNAALRRLLQQGFSDREGRPVAGMQELLERLRERRRQEREQFDLGGVYSEIAEQLNEVVDIERQALDELEEEAERSGDERRREVTSEVVADRRSELGLLPDDLAGKARSLSRYEFASSEARERFEELMERLRQEVVQSYLDQAAGALSSMGDEGRDRLRQALDGLNRMLEQRAAGEELDPSFEKFMSDFGDFFPGDPQNLDELLEQLAQRMAATSAMLASMTAGQRQQLQALMDGLLGDMDLSWQIDRLAGNLRTMFPEAASNRRVSFSGADAPGLAEASDIFSRLADLDQLEQLLSGSPQPGALAEIDTDRVRELLGHDSAASLAELQRLAKRLEDAGLVEQREGRLELTPAACARSASELSGSSSRASPRTGSALTSSPSRARATSEPSRPAPTPSAIASTCTSSARFETPSPARLSASTSPRRCPGSRAGRPVRAVMLTGRPGPAGRGPVSGYRSASSPTTSRSSRPSSSRVCATVLLLDLSLSMPMRDNFLAAKKVAMAMHSLISTNSHAIIWALWVSRRSPARSGRPICPRCPGISSTAPTCSTPSCSAGGCSPATPAHARSS